MVRVNTLKTTKTKPHVKGPGQHYFKATRSELTQRMPPITTGHITHTLNIQAFKGYEDLLHVRLTY